MRDLGVVIDSHAYNGRMDDTITLRDLRNGFAAVLRRVQAGHLLVVTRNGVPVAELRPVKPRRFVTRRTLMQTARRAARVNAGRFRKNLDAVVDPSLNV